MEDNQQRRSRSLKDVPDRELFEACRRFLEEGQSAAAVSEWLSQQGLGLFKREQIYPLVSHAVQRGIVALRPPRALNLEAEFSVAFPLGPDNVRIVDVETAGLEAVAHEAARLIADICEATDLSDGRQFTIGFAAGETSRRTCLALKDCLERRSLTPPLRLVALTSGLLMSEPETSPSTFMIAFRDYLGEVEYVPLYSTPVVHASDLEAVKKEPLLRDSFAVKDSVHVVVTSCEDARHGSSRLRRALEKILDGDTVPDDYLGDADLLFQPYTAAGPVSPSPSAYRAVSLYDWEDLRRSPAENRRVVLVAGTGPDGESKAEALLPLLENPSLSVSSDAVLDIRTVKKLLALKKSR